MKAWTPEEDAELTRLYATEASAREIGVALGRTKLAVKNRVHTLGLKKPDDATNSGRFLPGQTSWNKGKKGLVMGGAAPRRGSSRGTGVAGPWRWCNRSARRGSWRAICSAR